MTEYSRVFYCGRCYQFFPISNLGFDRGGLNKYCKDCDRIAGEKIAGYKNKNGTEKKRRTGSGKSLDKYINVWLRKTTQ
jgi:hypothetical protein